MIDCEIKKLLEEYERAQEHGFSEDRMEAVEQDIDAHIEKTGVKGNFHGCLKQAFEALRKTRRDRDRHAHSAQRYSWVLGEMLFRRIEDGERIQELEARVLALTASVEALEAKRQELEGE